MSALAHIEASDGYRLAYRTWPAVGSRRATIVLLNGVMSNSLWFEPVAPALRERGFHLVGADRRGSGPNKEGWGDAPSAARLVDDVLEVVDAEREGPVVLLGWCWGAALAINAAAKIGDRLAGLILVTPGMYNSKAMEASVQAQRETIERSEPDALVVKSPVLEAWFTDGPQLDGFVRQDTDRVQDMTPRLLDVTRKLATGAMIRLRKVAVPKLLILAEHDEATDNAATMAALDGIPTVTLPTKHGVQFDAPDALAAEIAAFADTVV